MIEVKYNALDNYNETEQVIRTLPFGSYVSPVDGVNYPGICPTPPQINARVHSVLEQLLGTSIVPRFQFARLSVEGVVPPHKVHNDATMGDYTSILYLSDHGGTTLHTHREYGFSEQPETEEELQAWHRDTNVVEAWHTDLFIPAKRNKLTCYNASRLHAATDGYGRDATDGRLVLVTFFDLL